MIKPSHCQGIRLVAAAAEVREVTVSRGLF